LTAGTEAIKCVEKTRTREADEAKEYDLSVWVIKKTSHAGRTDEEVGVKGGRVPCDARPTRITHERWAGGRMILVEVVESIADGRARITFFDGETRHGTRPRKRGIEIGK
jgi:hypothetical protein